MVNTTLDFGLAMALVRGLPPDHLGDFRSSVIDPAMTIHDATNGAADGLALEVYGTPLTSVVPEPSSLVSAALGLAALAGGFVVRRARSATIPPR